MVVIDTLIWPSPPEPRLLESIATDLERTRGRLKLVGQRYLDPIAAPLAAPQVASMLARNLALLKPVKEQMKPTPHHLAALIDAVMIAEHAYLEVERLAVLADEPRGTNSRKITAKKSRLLSGLWTERSPREPRTFSPVCSIHKTLRNWSRTCA